MMKADTAARYPLRKFRGPERLVKARRPAVKGVRPVIQRELKVMTVQNETAATDAICKATYSGAEIRAIRKVSVGVEFPDNHIVQTTQPVRHIDRHQSGSSRTKGYLEGAAWRDR